MRPTPTLAALFLASILLLSGCSKIFGHYPTAVIAKDPKTLPESFLKSDPRVVGIYRRPLWYLAAVKGEESCALRRSPEGNLEWQDRKGAWHRILAKRVPKWGQVADVDVEAVAELKYQYPQPDPFCCPNLTPFAAPNETWSHALCLRPYFLFVKTPLSSGAPIK